MKSAMRKTLLGTFAGLLVMTAQTTPTAPIGATYLSGKDVQETLKGAPKNSATDQELRTVDAGKLNVGIGVVYRSSKAKPSAVEHDNLTEVYQILEGAGTLTTGGEIVT